MERRGGTGRRTAAFAGRLGDVNPWAERTGLTFRLTATRSPAAPAGFASVDCGAIRFESWYQRGAATLAEPPRGDRYHLVIPTRSGGRLRLGKRELPVEAGRHAVVLSPRRAHEVDAAAGWRDFSVALPAEGLRRRWQELAGTESEERVEFPARIDLATRGGARVRRLIEFMAREAEREDGLMAVPASRARLVETLETVLLTELPHSHRQIREEPADPGPQIVQLAEWFMAEHLGRRVRMAAVAASAGVSLRALQEAFRRHRGHGPAEFLRRCRLERAKARLRDVPRASITTIALECGFAHASHFGAAYRQYFDETPSQTRDSARFR